MTKKNLILSGLLFALLGIGTVLYINNTRTDTFTSSSRDFAYKETDQISKIFAANKQGQKYLMEKINGKWVLDGQYEANEDFVVGMLETLEKMEVVNIIPKGAIPLVMKEIGTMGKKIEFYNDRNKLVKCFYIGEGNLRETAVNMVLEGSNIPYEVSLPYFEGNIGWRFWPLELIDLRTRVILNEKAENIKKIEMEYPRNTNESFTLEVLGQNQFTVKPLSNVSIPKTTNLRNGEVNAYLAGMEKVYSSRVVPKIDLIKDTLVSEVAFAKMTLTDQKNNVRKIEFYPIINHQEAALSKTPTYVASKFLTIVNESNYYISQREVIDKLFYGYSLFFDK